MKYWKPSRVSIRWNQAYTFPCALTTLTFLPLHDAWMIASVNGMFVLNSTISGLCEASIIYRDMFVNESPWILSYSSKLWLTKSVSCDDVASSFSLTSWALLNSVTTYLVETRSVMTHQAHVASWSLILGNGSCFLSNSLFEWILARSLPFTTGTS